mmetsp:Transcript_32637/g.45299  ORF Transcript_32637/g.45299 Transcript_32637/m.45299 type:complete len:182 (+) Transcript_32637:187-732(+)
MTCKEETEMFVRTLFVLEASSRIKIAGGQEHDLPLSDSANLDIIRHLEAETFSSSPSELVLADFPSEAVKDLKPKGRGVNPHHPVAVDVVRIPLLEALGAEARRTLKQLVKKEAGTSLGLSEDVVAMTVMATMQPSEREEKLGLFAKRVIVNDCERARELAREFDVKRQEAVARVAAAQIS